MLLNSRSNGVIIIHNAISQRMISAHLFKNGVITVGCHMIKIFVTLSDNGFPNKELRCESL